MQWKEHELSYPVKWISTYGILIINPFDGRCPIHLTVAVFTPVGNAFQFMISVHSVNLPNKECVPLWCLHESECSSTATCLANVVVSVFTYDIYSCVCTQENNFSNDRNFIIHIVLLRRYLL